MSTPIIQAAVVAANKAAGIKFTGPLLWKVTYRRCAAHSAPNVQASAQVLGLRKLNHTVIVKNVRPVRGLLHVLKHYISVEPYVFNPKTVPTVYPVK